MNFNGLKNAKVSGRGVYLSPGEYDVEITKCEVIHTRGQGDAFVADFKVLASQEKSGGNNHPVGSARNYYQGLQDTDIAWPELKRFAYAVLGAKTEEEKAKVDEKVESIYDAIDKGNHSFFTGMKAHVVVIQRTTKKNQKVIDAATFLPYEGK